MTKKEAVEKLAQELYDWEGRAGENCGLLWEKLEEKNKGSYRGEARFIVKEFYPLFPKTPDNSGGYEDESIQSIVDEAEAKYEPQPGEGRLLTDEEFHKLHEDFFGRGSGCCSEIDDTDLSFRVAKAQDAKTALICNQECQRRMEGIFKEIGECINRNTSVGRRGKDPGFNLISWFEFFSALKKKEGVK